MKKEPKEGDTVVTFVRHSNGTKKRVTGKIKSVKNIFKRKVYLIVDGVVEDFTTSTVQKV